MNKDIKMGEKMKEEGCCRKNKKTKKLIFDGIWLFYGKFLMVKSGHKTFITK